MFLTTRYRAGWIQYSYYNGIERIYVQYRDAEGKYQSRRCKSYHAAKCFLARHA